MKTAKKPPSEIKRTHGGARPGAGRKPGKLNKLTLRLHGEQRRTRESRPMMLLRVLNQGRVRKHKLTVAELLRIAKEAAPHFARPMRPVRVKVRCVNGRFVPVGRSPEGDDPLALAMDAAEPEEANDEN